MGWNRKVELNGSKDLSVGVGVSFVLHEGKAVAVSAQVELLLDVIVVSHADQQVSFHVDVHVHFRVFFKRDLAANYDALFCLRCFSLSSVSSFWVAFVRL